MTTTTAIVIMSVAAVLGVVLVCAVAAWRDVRVARATGIDPRVDRAARRDAAQRVRGGGQERQG